MAAAAAPAAAAAATATGVDSGTIKAWEEHDRAVISFALSIAGHFNFEFDVLTVEAGRLATEFRRDAQGKWSATAWLDPDNVKSPWVEYADLLEDGDVAVTLAADDPTLLSSFLPPSFPEWCVNDGQRVDSSPVVPLATAVACMFAHVRDSDKDVDLDAIEQALRALGIKSGKEATMVFVKGVAAQAKELVIGEDMDRYAKEDGAYIYCDGSDIWKDKPWKVSKRTKKLVKFVIYRLKCALLRAEVMGDPSQFEAALVGKGKGKRGARKALDNGDDASAAAPQHKRARVEEAEAEADAGDQSKKPLTCVSYNRDSVSYGYIKGAFEALELMADNAVEFVIFTNGAAIGDGNNCLTHVGLYQQWDASAEGPVVGERSEIEASELSDVCDGLQTLAVFVPLDKNTTADHIANNHFIDADGFGAAFADVERVYIFRNAEGLWFFTSCDGPGVDDVRAKVTRCLTDHYSGSDHAIRCTMPFELFDTRLDAEKLRERIPRLSLVLDWAQSAEAWYQKEFVD